MLPGARADSSEGSHHLFRALVFFHTGACADIPGKLLLLLFCLIIMSENIIFDFVTE